MKKSIKVYLYGDSGKYLREFNSIDEFTTNFNFSSNIFSHNDWLTDKIYHFKDGRVASLEKIGRKGVLKAKRYKNNKFVGGGKTRSETCYKKEKKGKVLMYDLDGDLIAEFKSIFQAILLTGFDQTCFRINKKKGFKLTKTGIKIVVLSNAT